MVKQGYKQTEVGVIPEDWDIKTLKKVAPLQRGFDLPYSQMKDGSYPVVFSNGVGAYHAQYMVKGPGVVTGRSGTIGKIHYVDENYWPHNTSLWVTNFCGNYPKYIYYLFNTINWELYNSGSGVPTLNRNDIHDLKCVIPSIEEQKRIAEVLSDVDCMISLLEKLIAKKKAVKLGAMQELLTGKKRLPGFTGEWKKIELKELIKEFIVPMRDKPKDLSGPIPWCRIEDFNGKYLYSSKTNQGVTIETISNMNLKVFPKNTLLVSCSAFLGRCAIVGSELITNQTFIGLVPNNKVNVEFLFYVMIGEEKNLNLLSSGTTISYLSREQFEDYKIYIPCDVLEQTAIASTLSDMDNEIETLEQKLEKTRQIKQGMMQQLLTGKIRLV